MLKLAERERPRTPRGDLGVARRREIREHRTRVCRVSDKLVRQCTARAHRGTPLAGAKLLGTGNPPLASYLNHCLFGVI